MRELPRAPDPVAVAERLRALPYPWLLDSARAMPRLGRFSFVGADPYLVLRASGTGVEIECRRAARPDVAPGRSRLDCSALDAARALLPPKPLETDGDAPFPFAGGAVGYFAYELARQLEPMARRAADRVQAARKRGALALPDLALLFVDRLVAIDGSSRRAWAVGLGFGLDLESARARAAQAGRDMASRADARRLLPARGPGELRPRAGEEPAELCSSLDEASHAAAVDEIGREIAAGNVYQANLTYRMEAPIGRADPWHLYRELRAVNPAPFAAYLELPEAAILGSSPERFLALDAAGRVESRPIKGTRPRGDTREADARLARALAGSEKDRAENLMIVDLVRNDLGRVCEPGSIAVPELMAIECHPTVFQMVSTIVGRLAAGRDGLDLVSASFPPGSMTGAPKIAAMEIIDRLEPVPRGVYSGALGYLDVRGGLDLCVVIRTVIVVDGRAYVHVGGAIVADSQTRSEYAETRDKARAPLAAIARVVRHTAPVGVPRVTAGVW